MSDLVMELLKKIYGWKIWFEYDYLQSHLVMVYFQTEVDAVNERYWYVVHNVLSSTRHLLLFTVKWMLIFHC